MHMGRGLRVKTNFCCYIQLVCYVYLDGGFLVQGDTEQAAGGEIHWRSLNSQKPHQPWLKVVGGWEGA